VNVLDLNLTCKLPSGVVIVPFIVEHLNGFKSVQPDMQGHSDEETAEYVRNQAKCGKTVSVIERGKTIGIFGAVKIWNGLEEAWFLLDEATRRYGISMTKVAKKWIALKFQEDSLNRLQITVRCSDVRAKKWAMCLGFQIDGVMRQFGPDASDYFMMSIVRED